MIEFRLRDFLAPRRLLYWRQLLWKSQYWPRERQRELQWKHLARLLTHCFAHVPYYRELFADICLKRKEITGIDDLPRIPVLSKDAVRERHDSFKADDFTRYRPRQVPTSGTTGTMMYVYWDLPSNILELMCQWRAFSWAGYRLGEPFLDLRSRILRDPHGYRWNWKCRGLEISADSVSASSIEQFAAVLRKFAVQLWRGHPSAIDAVCQLLHQAGIDDIKPKGVITASEALLGHQRRSIERYTGVPVCDNYGMVEHSALICQCPQGGYHIASEYGIVEILKEDGSPARAGEEGRIIATSLHNMAFPLLRYDTQDYAVVSDRDCPCGRRLPLIESISGRCDDRLLAADGRWISGLYASTYFLQGIGKSQIVQKEPLAIELYIVPTRDYSEKTEEALLSYLRERLGQAMQITVCRVEDVPYRGPGKFKFVKSFLDGPSSRRF